MLLSYFFVLFEEVSFKTESSSGVVVITPKSKSSQSNFIPLYSNLMRLLRVWSNRSYKNLLSINEQKDSSCLVRFKYSFTSSLFKCTSRRCNLPGLLQNSSMYFLPELLAISAFLLYAVKVVPLPLSFIAFFALQKLLNTCPYSCFHWLYK